MSYDNKKAIITEYFSEWLNDINTKKELTKELKKVLKKNEEYQKLVKERNKLNNQLKNIEEGIKENQEIKKINENIFLIKESLSEETGLKKSTVSKMFNFYKTKWEKNIDELQEIIEQWIEIFEEKGE